MKDVYGKYGIREGREGLYGIIWDMGKDGRWIWYNMGYGKEGKVDIV